MCVSVCDDVDVADIRETRYLPSYPSRRRGSGGSRTSSGMTRLVDKTVKFRMKKLSLHTFKSMALKCSLTSAQKTVEVRAERNLLGSLLMLHNTITSVWSSSLNFHLDQFHGLWQPLTVDWSKPIRHSWCTPWKPLLTTQTMSHWGKL